MCKGICILACTYICIRNVCLDYLLLIFTINAICRAQEPRAILLYSRRYKYFGRLTTSGIQVRASTRMSDCVHVRACVCGYIPVCVGMRMCMCICMYACVYICLSMCGCACRCICGSMFTLCIFVQMEAHAPGYHLLSAFQSTCIFWNTAGTPWDPGPCTLHLLYKLAMDSPDMHF